MANNNTNVKQLYICDGANKNFPITFFFIAGEEFVIKAYLIDNVTNVVTLLALTADYTLDAPATKVITNVAYPATKSILVKRVSPRTQLSEYIQGVFPFNSIEQQFDRLICIAQELEDDRGTLLALQDGSPLSNLKLPTAEANKLIGWNAGATALENKSVLDIATIQGDITSLKSRATNLEAQDVTTIAKDAAQDVRLDAHDVLLAGLRVDVDAHYAILIATGATMANFPAEIVNLQNQINAINSYAASVAALLVTTASHTAQLALINPAITQLTTRMNQVEASKDISTFAGSISIANNQIAPVAIVDVNGILANDFKRDGDGTQLAIIDLQIDRRTDSEMRFTRVKLIMRYISETALWYIVRENTTAFIGEPDGVDFTVVTDGGKVGQVYYTSDNILGLNYTGKMKFLGKEIPTGV